MMSPKIISYVLESVSIFMEWCNEQWSCMFSWSHKVYTCDCCLSHQPLMMDRVTKLWEIKLISMQQVTRKTFVHKR